MKKKYIETPLVNEYLQNISDIKAVETNPFFYTRLKARMEKELLANQPKQNLEWVFIIYALAIFLSVNCWILLHPNNMQKHEISNTTQQSFADTYGIGNSLSY